MQSMTNEDIIAKLSPIKAKFAQMQQELLEESKKIFAEVSKQLFDENPKLKSFGWTQYTPYFNDGNTCYFNVWADEPTINSFESYDDYFDNNASEDDMTEAEFEQLQRTVERFIMAFDEDTLEEMFGDHAEITVTSTGVEVDGYDHD